MLESDGCEGLFKFESSLLATAAVVLLYLLTLAASLWLARAIRGSADIGHPVFFVVFQEAVVLSALTGVLCATYAARKFIVREASAISGALQYCNFMVAYLTMIFHQCSWLCITYLRYDPAPPLPENVPSGK